jgi:hypothetical protein
MDFSQYYSITSNLEKIDFFGGEPFLNITQLELLEYLVDNDLSKNITLYYSTNVSNYPTPRLQHAWNKFKRVELSMSIDGLGKGFEYLRWPARWSEATDIVKYLQSLKSTLDCEIYTMASITVSAMNVYDIDPLIAWTQKHIGNYYINMVNSPDYLAVHILPEEIKSAIRSRVSSLETLGYLGLKPHDPAAFRQFIIWMKRQDLYRNQEFATVFSEYFELLKPYWDSINDLSEQNFYRLHPDI